MAVHTERICKLLGGRKKYSFKGGEITVVITGKVYVVQDTANEAMRGGVVFMKNGVSS
jgi:hypothetical protein